MAVKEVKMNASLEKYPDYCWLDGLYDAGLFKMEQVEAVEKKLKIQSSEVRLDNFSMEDFKTKNVTGIFLFSVVFSVLILRFHHSISFSRSWIIEVIQSTYLATSV